MKSKKIKDFIEKIKKMPRKQVILTVSIISIVILVIVIFIVSDNSRNENTGEIDYPSGSVYSTSSTLYIDSNISGVSVQGDPYCGSNQLEKTTPYDCILEEGQRETVLTATDQVTVDGKTYSFVSWDGCSESNEDKKICKVETEEDQVKFLKVTYQLLPSYQPALKPAEVEEETIGCPAQDKYIIVGPQSFHANTSGYLVLYNETKDYQKATYAQFLSDGNCKEIPLSHEMKTIEVEKAYHTGFGLASSAFITRTSVPTSIAPGGHRYIAVVDKGNFQEFKAIFRDDGTLRMDKEGLVDIFDPDGDKTSSNGLWKFKGWIDSHTALIYVPWNISGPDSDCQSYDFDAGTYTDVESSLCSW